MTSVLADENVPRVAVQALRDAGLDVRSVSEDMLESRLESMEQRLASLEADQRRLSEDSDFVRRVLSSRS